MGLEIIEMKEGILVYSKIMYLEILLLSITNVIIYSFLMYPSLLNMYFDDYPVSTSNCTLTVNFIVSVQSRAFFYIMYEENQYYGTHLLYVEIMK